LVTLQQLEELSVPIGQPLTSARERVLTPLKRGEVIKTELLKPEGDDRGEGIQVREAPIQDFLRVKHIT